MTKKTGLKIVIILLVMGVMSFSDCSLAAEGENSIGDIAWFFNVIVNALQWLWIPVADIAGQLMTNKWVYGEILGLDSLLWKYRNVVKNISNFCLGFYFVYLILTSIKKDTINKIKSGLLWIMIAGIGIQASWFLTAATVDVSTITLTMAGALPSQMISQDQNLYEGMKKGVNKFLDIDKDGVVKGFELNLFPEGKENNTSEHGQFVLEKEVKIEDLFDTMSINAQSAAGPLVYMGLSILETPNLISVDSSDAEGFKKTILNTIIQGGTTIVYSIEMIVLLYVVVFRLVYLWMFIVLSPLAILVACIKKAGEKFGEKGGLSSFLKLIQIKTFLVNVFKPTIIVLGISIAVIFVTLMSNVLVDKSVSKPIDIGGVQFVSENDSTSNANGDQTYTTTMQSGFLKITFAHAAKSFFEVLLSLLTVVLVYIIIKFAVNMGSKDGGFVGKKVEEFQKTAQDMFTSVPIVPVASYDKEGVPTTKYMSARDTLNLPSTFVNRKTADIETKISEQQSVVVDSWFGTEGLTETKKANISSSKNGKFGLDALEAQREHIKENVTDRDALSEIVLDKNVNPFWANQFEEWLNNPTTERNIERNSDWGTLLRDWEKLSPDKPEERTLEKLFTGIRGSEHVRTYANFFGLGSHISSWEVLKKATMPAKSKD